MDLGRQISCLTSLSPSGQSERQYLLSSENENPAQKSITQPSRKSHQTYNESVLDQSITLLKEIFLPAGYPASVSDDYTEYQIYDSLQAFSSSIASLLSSRAVLTGLGVGDSSATPTSALLLHILQDSTGRIATILFAHRLGGALEPETKQYRLLADIFNDISIILDCMSPLLPRGLARVSILSAAGVLRALCGVAAGATKASLSVHFAQGGDGTGNVGELNAKDASQETVVSLLGSLFGTLVVSLVVGPVATWVTLLGLLAIHLFMNYRAVCAVRMRTLNRQRAVMVLGDLFAGKGLRSPMETGLREHIFERGGLVRSSDGRPIGWVEVGVSVERIAASISHLNRHQDHNQDQDEDLTLASLLTLTSSSNYILSLSPGSSRQNQPTILLSFSTTATPTQILEAYAHAILILQKLSPLALNHQNHQSHQPSTLGLSRENITSILNSTRETLLSRWEADVQSLTEKGWDLSVASLEVQAGWRYSLDS